MNGWLPSILLMAFALLIFCGVAYEVRLLRLCLSALTRYQLAAGWLVALLAAACGLGLSVLAVMCAGR